MSNATSTSIKQFETRPDIKESAIFQLQKIDVEGLTLNVFFDSGCGDMIIKKSAVEQLANVGRAKQVLAGPFEITGVGNRTTVCEEGVYSISLPLNTGGNALCGICLPEITSEFPLYDLTELEKDIRKKCYDIGNEDLVSKLPKLPRKVGGIADILIGIKYLKYFPKKVFQFESGLGIYESVFNTQDGSTGVVGGPHKEFSQIENEGKKSRGTHTSKTGYYLSPACVYWLTWKLGNNMPLIGQKIQPELSQLGLSKCIGMEEEKFNDVSFGDNSLFICRNKSGCFAAKRAAKCVKSFDAIERAGSEVTYRCPECRNCDKCKNGPRVENISFQEEIEQDLIERSVTVNIDRNNYCKITIHRSSEYLFGHK